MIEMIKKMKIQAAFWSVALLTVGCGSINIVSTPIENIDAVPLKVMALTEEERQSWGHADLLTDTIP
ncbi:MAG: peptidase S8, partial [Flavobacteriaceae bacterium]|nr:peptidase S8 [Flavobacteriaceae bacterium]